VIEALARKVALDALDGRASAQKLVLAILDSEDRGGAEKSMGAAVEESRNETDEEDEEEADEENGEEDRFVYEDESARQFFGDRYGEFKERFERAVNAIDIDALCDLAADFGDTNLPWCREKSRENQKKRRGARCCTAKQEDTEVEQRVGSGVRTYEKFRQSGNFGKKRFPSILVMLRECAASREGDGQVNGKNGCDSNRRCSASFVWMLRIRAA